MKRAIVLADEKSPRSINGSGHVKALAKVAGLPLIVRNLRTLHAAGVEEAVVVTGYEASRISAVLARYHLGVQVTEVYNPNWKHGSAHSVIAAADYIDGPCLLVPCDHLYPPSLVHRLFQFPTPADSMAIAIDRRIEDVFDENESLKVRIEDGLVTDVGMQLDSPNGVAPGMVRIPVSLVDTLRRLVSDIDLSVLDCIRAMARRNRLKSVDVENARWISISSPQARRYAELLLKLHGDTLETPSDTGEHATLLNPGPVGTTPRVKAAVGARDMCHREPVFSSLLDSVQRKLRVVFGATDQHDVLMVTTSGTGALESAISTFVPQGRSFLVVRNGAFGDRQVEIARTYGIDVIEVAVPWGEKLPLGQVERVLADNPGIAAVGVVHHETSIGVLNPVAEVAQLAKNYGAISIVDAVSSLGGEDINVERDQIDVCIASANKCLHAFSGLASVCVRQDTWNVINGDTPRSYYMDLRRYRKYMVERRQTPFTPAVNTMMSLNAALEELLEMGLKNRQQHYRKLSANLRQGLTSLGFNLLVDPERAAHSLTLVEVPEGHTYTDIYQGIKERGFIIYECKDKLAGRYFQVANMGALEESDIDEFLAAVEDYLDEVRQAQKFKMRHWEAV
ncbi:MAG: aminotransferase class V-fold PLP-dependent enzyme [Proteobacteria bacterium]|nr:aminotransferase class V-fold PLP-dependent enzyme [Pseudomonadota bacterium]